MPGTVTPFGTIINQDEDNFILIPQEEDLEHAIEKVSFHELRKLIASGSTNFVYMDQFIDVFFRSELKGTSLDDKHFWCLSQDENNQPIILGADYKRVNRKQDHSETNISFCSLDRITKLGHHHTHYRSKARSKPQIFPWRYFRFSKFNTSSEGFPQFSGLKWLTKDHNYHSDEDKEEIIGEFGAEWDLDFSHIGSDRGEYNRVRIYPLSLNLDPKSIQIYYPEPTYIVRTESIRKEELLHEVIRFFYESVQDHGEWFKFGDSNNENHLSGIFIPSSRLITPFQFGNMSLRDPHRKTT